MLEIVTLVLGPVETNTYLVADPASREAVVIDPAWEGEKIARQASQRGWAIRQLWLTHAHFDHLAGAAGIVKQVTPEPPVALHPQDFALWSLNGGAALFGMHVDPGPRPSIRLEAGQELQIGGLRFEVRHVPGHTPGHVRILLCSRKSGLLRGRGFRRQYRAHGFAWRGSSPATGEYPEPDPKPARRNPSPIRSWTRINCGSGETHKSFLDRLACSIIYC